MHAEESATITIMMSPDNARAFEQLCDESGLTDPSHLFQAAMNFFEKAVKARRRGYLIGSVPGDAEAGKNGIIEILLSQEMLALDAIKARGASLH